ncbi:hypothetical protein NE865_14815 [Phthorimaea operculella]|nr:hypothetical protein NE865_14815 [Phthorimaea operculella]
MYALIIDARRRVRSLEQVPRSDIEAATGTRALVQGSATFLIPTLIWQISRHREGYVCAPQNAMRIIDARRRVRSLEQVPRSDIEAATGTRALVQAALGSFRWPPYLLAVWVLVLMLTHALHCVVSVVERALPNLKRFCQYFRAWTEDSWKAEADMNHRLLPVALALVTGLMYTVYFALFVLYSVALWSIEPLCTDLEEKQSSVDVMETKVTNYVDEISSKTNIKH